MDHKKLKACVVTFDLEDNRRRWLCDHEHTTVNTAMRCAFAEFQQRSAGKPEYLSVSAKLAIEVDGEYIEVERYLSMVGPLGGREIIG